MRINSFIEKYKKYAIETQDKTGIDYRFILAQSALETGWGDKAPGNMMFGVKASKNTPENKRQLITTREVLPSINHNFPQVISITKRSDGLYTHVVKDWFRKYDTPEESFTDHANFFFDNKRYERALDFKHDPYSFAEEIAKAGYATDPNYANLLKSIIKSIDKRL